MRSRRDRSGGVTRTKAPTEAGAELKHIYHGNPSAARRSGPAPGSVSDLNSAETKPGMSAFGGEAEVDFGRLEVCF